MLSIYLDIKCFIDEHMQTCVYTAVERGENVSQEEKIKLSTSN